MGFKFPNGAQFGISTAIAAAIAATGVSNANPAVASGIITGSFAEGDVLVLQSSNPLLNNLVVQAGTVTTSTTDSVQLLGLDTTDTDLYDLSGVTLTLAKASAFVDFTQQGDPSTSGGDPINWTGTLLEDPLGREISIPIGTSAQITTLPLYYDPSLPWFAAAKKAAIKRDLLVLRISFLDGDKQYSYGFLGFNASPSMQSKNPMANQMTFTSRGLDTLVEAA